MAEEMATLPSGIEMCYETFGDPADPPVLLVMGLGGPMGWWTNDFCTQLADRGFFVIRYDNRDTGRSTKLREHRVTKKEIIKAFVGRGKAPYGLSDLADDAFGLLDHLGIERVHLAGVSMGGMISQTMAIARSERVHSLTSIMSTTGKRTVGWTHPKLFTTMLGAAGRTREDYVDQSLRSSLVIGSPGFPTDEEIARARAIETFERGWTASGVARHMLAVLTQPDRTRDLANLDIPTTVVHGLSDPLVNPSGGRATAAAIRDSEFVAIANMGHDLPVQLYGTFIDAIVRSAERAATKK
ncbi:alpha/beta fold hydrolase [Aeromicrobium sp.]